MIYDPVAQTIRNKVSCPIDQKAWIFAWRYIVGIWLTALYHGWAYGFTTKGAGEIFGFAGPMFWPVYWFVESIRWLT